MSLGDDTVAQPRFRYGDLVRVKPGVRHYDYPDLPIGGWAGEIVELDVDNEERDVRVTWSVETLESMPRIYIERCERDDMDETTMWLVGDELATNDGTPATIEQPDLPEWARHAGDEQLAAIFGLGEDDPIPDTDAESLAKYHQFLAAHLALPFEATFDPEDNPVEDVVRVLELLPPSDATADDGSGLNCTIDDDEVAQAVPLVELFVSNDHSNSQLLADYRHWIDGGIEDDDEDEDGWGDEEYDDDQDDEYGPNSVVGRIFKATMNDLRSGHDILGELPNRDELQRVRSLAEALIMSDLEPEPESERELQPNESPRLLRKSGTQVGRNDPCPCGSGKKFKKCCLKQRE